MVPAPLRAALDGPPRRLAAGDELFREGDSADHFFVVHTGTVEVVRRLHGRTIRVSAFGPGEFGGEVPLLSGTPHLATGRAHTDATLHLLDADAFWRLLTSPDARDVILGNMAVRLAELHHASAESEMLAALGRVTAGVAHELLNPLNLVQGFAAVAADHLAGLDAPPGSPTAEALESLGHVQAHGRRAVATVRRLDAHVAALRAPRSAFDLAALIHTAVADADVTLDVPARLPRLWAAPAALAAVLRGLVDNAVDAVRRRPPNPDLPAGRVTVRAVPVDRGVLVTVEDNGVGIPDDFLARVFEPFATSQGGAEGAGLGLAVAYDVVRAGHGGDIAIESREGEGTTVTVRLPTSTA